LGRFLDNLSAAVTTLVELCQGARLEMTRLMAAKSIVDYSIKIREATELTERISRLEEAQPQRRRYGA
jgi:hypothetical protein